MQDFNAGNILKKTYLDETFAGRYFRAFLVTRKKSLKVISQRKRFRHLLRNKFPRKKNLIGS